MSNVNVLVVDDIPQNLVAMEALLSRPGLRVLQASSGVEALELLLEHEVALALLDVNMPRMDGFELAELMRGNPRTRTIPLIFITAAMQEPARTFRGYQAGAVDFINKPFVPEMLVSKVRVFTELYTQRKQLASQLSELKRALQVNEMFTAVLGHDLRTPLATVLNGAELIAHISDDAHVKATAARILSGAQRMETMVSQLLDVARARGGNMQFHPAPNDYRDICTRIIQEFAHPAQAGNIVFRCNGDTSGLFDAGHMSRILSNLVGNALQHGQADTQVTVRFDGTHPEQVVLHVHNAGHIPPDRIADIFEPYQSTKTRDGGASGLGLGLYIVRQFVQAHCGSVTVHSTPQDGTLFEVRLPRRCEHCAA